MNDQPRIYDATEYAHIADELEQRLRHCPEAEPEHVRKLIGKLSVAMLERGVDPAALQRWSECHDSDSAMDARVAAKRMQQLALVEAKQAELKGEPFDWPSRTVFLELISDDPAAGKPSARTDTATDTNNWPDGKAVRKILGIPEGEHYKVTRLIESGSLIVDKSGRGQRFDPVKLAEYQAQNTLIVAPATIAAPSSQQTPPIKLKKQYVTCKACGEVITLAPGQFPKCSKCVGGSGYEPL